MIGLILPSNGCWSGCGLLRSLDGEALTSGPSCGSWGSLPAARSLGLDIETRTSYLFVGRQSLGSRRLEDSDHLQLNVEGGVGLGLRDKSADLLVGLGSGHSLEQGLDDLQVGLDAAAVLGLVNHVVAVLLEPGIFWQGF